MVASPESNPGGSEAAANPYGDELTRSLKESRPRLAEDLVFAPLSNKGETVYQVESTVDGKFYRVGSAEYVFLSLFDGNTSFAEAVAVTAQRMGADALSESQAMQVMTWLIQHNLIEGAGIPTTPEAKASLTSRFNPFFNKIRLGCPDEFFSAATAGLGWLFHPVSVTFGIMLMVVSFGMLLGNLDRFVASSGNVFAPGNWIWLTATWLVLKIVHELGHGVACKRFGGRVAELGVLLILFAPMAYVDVTSSWRFASKWKRIGVALAGMYIELLVAAVATIGWVYATSPLTEHVLYNVIITATVATLLFNANPLMRFDGYYVLSDLTETPNLYADGAAAFRSGCRWMFFGTRQAVNTAERNSRTRWVKFYGLFASLWQFLVTASIAIAAAAMFRRAGLAIVCIGVAIYAFQAISKMAKSMDWHWRHRPASCVRAGAIAGTLLLGAWAAWAIAPNPMALTAPGILQYEDASIVRAETAGFVREILVQDGQLVKAGQPLVELENTELLAECKTLRSQLNEVRAKEAIAMDERDAAAVQVAVRERDTIEQRLADKEKRRERLVVVAPIDGHVVARGLSQRVGVYVDVGEEILTIGDESRKEVVLSLRSKHIDDALRCVGNEVKVRLGSNEPVSATLVLVEPRASTDLPHPALAATDGGPLPVRQVAQDDGAGDSVELIDPRFKANVRLRPEDAEKLACGQRGYARLGMRSETLGRWMVVSTREWFEAKMAAVE